LGAGTTVGLGRGGWRGGGGSLAPRGGRGGFGQSRGGLGYSAPPKPVTPELPPWYHGYDKALPPALLALCPEEKCNLCGIEFNGPSISQSHYHGKAHAKKVSAYLDAAEDIPDGQKPKKVPKMESGLPMPVSATASGLFCPTCNLVCTSQVVYDDHMKGKNHASKVRAAQLAASGELAGQLQCLVCHVFASTHEILQAHIDGKAHKKKVAALSVKGADLRCNLCDVTSTDKDGHERHMNGKRHKEKLEGPKEPKEREVIDYNNFNPKIAAVKEEVLVKEEVAA